METVDFISFTELPKKDQTQKSLNSWKKRKKEDSCPLANPINKLSMVSTVRNISIG